MTVDFALIGRRIESLRKERGWTQSRLAEKAELSNNYLSNIEHSYSIPSVETLVRICAALEVTPNDVLLGASRQEKGYMNRDVLALLDQCTPREKRCVRGFIRGLLAEREG